MGYLFDAMQKARPAAVAPSEATPTTDDASLEPIQLDPRQLRRIDERIVVWADPAGLEAEEYRAIRTGLLARWQHKRHLSHVISSAVPQEGKTITSLNLAASLGELSDRTCVVVEADLRLPMFAKLLGLPTGPGLVELLRGDATLGQVLVPIAGRQVWVLPAGADTGGSAAQLMSGPAMADTVSQLQRRFDHVVLDTPPVNAVADAGVIGALCDEVILVARMQRTPVPLIEQARRTLAQAQAKIAGVIATGAAARTQAYGYGYRYGRYATAMRRAA